MIDGAIWHYWMKVTNKASFIQRPKLKYFNVSFVDGKTEKKVIRKGRVNDLACRTLM